MNHDITINKLTFKSQYAVSFPSFIVQTDIKRKKNVVQYSQPHPKLAHKRDWFCCKYHRGYLHSNSDDLSICFATEPQHQWPGEIQDILYLSIYRIDAENGIFFTCSAMHLGVSTTTCYGFISFLMPSIGFLHTNLHLEIIIQHQD